MKKIYLTLSLIITVATVVMGQNQLDWTTYSYKLADMDPLICYDSTHNYYNTGNTTQATQITSIWTGNATELLVEPNYSLGIVMRTKADSSVTYKRGNTPGDTLAPVWSSASWYDAQYEKIIRQHVYAYYSGLTSFTRSDYYYGTTVDSTIYQGGTSNAGPLTPSFVRYFYKNTSGIYDSIVDRFYNNGNGGNDIKWTFAYNTQNNLTEWKYENPSYATSNKQYKLFYDIAGNQIDSIQYFTGSSLTYTSTHKYEYGTNNKWSKFTTHQLNLQSFYPNGVAGYRNSYWGSQVYCDSIDNFYYNISSTVYEKSSVEVEDYTASGFIQTQSTLVEGWVNNVSTKYVYSYNTTNTPTAITTTEKENEFSIFPNPTYGILNIALVNSTTPSSVSIINMLGQPIYSQKISENNTQIDMSEFTKGIYFVTLKSNNNVRTQKVIVD